MSLPEIEIYSEAADGPSDEIFSGYMSDSTCLSPKSGKRRLRRDTGCKGADSMATKVTMHSSQQKDTPATYVQGGTNGRVWPTANKHNTSEFLSLLRSRKIPRAASKRTMPTHGTREMLDLSSSASADDMFDSLDDVLTDGPTVRPVLREPSSRERSSAKIFMNRQNIRPWEASEESNLLEHIQEIYTTDASIKWDQVALKFGRTSVGCMTKYYALKSL
ncbi:hypothetical protein DL89DRAFT_269059 [Linderina pennispora]|uniref:Myb-like domain-containing protein n=1 Tax=Linderina pennispora TaxID=61395 RepID=A0A1Y1W2V2_9FUNG|nr:uncharacterized protein DL89DRAFT_269059 [Linderina pennispora]ORX67869.1 hypothetical protein DL89DRAFT_269059 [Linderina pennispora]